MKKQNLNNIYIISILLGIINLGCSDIFDKSPLDAVSDGTFWNTESDADLALIGCYDVNEGWGGEDFWVNRGLLFIDLAAGNGSEKENFTSSITDGTLNSSHWAMEAYWKHSYERIATCNNFLDNIGKIQMKDTKKNMMISEIRTIRAYEYFNLGLYFGNVPLVEHVLTIEQANSVFQSTRDVIWAFAEKELKESCEALPPTRPDSEQGRITQAAALAILGRLQMAGKKWSDAAESYKKIIDYNYYIIDPQYEELFWEEKEFSKEIILSTQYQEDVYSNVLPQYLWPIMSGGWHQFCPYNNLVKVYECIDGKTIDESPLYDKNNPYENRDPRLDYTIFVSDRTKFKGKVFISRPGSGSVDDFTKYNYNGYSIKKFCDENYNGNLMNSGCNWTLIRYAEVLLGYLESMLESGAAIDQALLNSTINKVRGRQAVQMPPVTITDQNKLRETVRRERRVEFAFEGLRYYDILRWGIAADELNGTFTGMKLTNDPANYTSYKVDDEGYYIFETKKFKKGIHELWPIPLSEMQINKNLVQNAGY